MRSGRRTGTHPRIADDLPPGTRVASRGSLRGVRGAAFANCCRSAALLAVAGLIAGCGGPDLWAFSSMPSTGQGLTVLLVWKDSPLDDATRLWIALDRVELLGGRQPVALPDRRQEHDMLALQN